MPALVVVMSVMAHPLSSMHELLCTCSTLTSSLDTSRTACAAVRVFVTPNWIVTLSEQLKDHDLICPRHVHPMGNMFGERDKAYGPAS